LPKPLASDLVAGSCCFSPPKGPVPLTNAYAWWKYVKGANWRHPEARTVT